MDEIRRVVLARTESQQNISIQGFARCRGVTSEQVLDVISTGYGMIA